MEKAKPISDPIQVPLRAPILDKFYSKLHKLFDTILNEIVKCFYFGYALNMFDVICIRDDCCESSPWAWFFSSISE